MEDFVVKPVDPVAEKKPGSNALRPVGAAGLTLLATLGLGTCNNQAIIGLPYVEGYCIEVRGNGKGIPGLEIKVGEEIAAITNDYGYGIIRQVDAPFQCTIVDTDGTENGAWQDTTITITADTTYVPVMLEPKLDSE